MFRLLCFTSAVLVFASATPTTIEKHPFHATIESQNGNICSGAIISQNIILSSASCLQNIMLLNLQVRAGNDILKQGGILEDVKQVKLHKRYQTDRKDFDIALVILENPLQLSQKVQLVDLPQALQSPQEGSRAELVGWGLDQDQQREYNEVLQELEMEITMLGKCKNAYASRLINITERMLCAAPVSSWKTSNARPGSPLVADNVLIGMSAWEQQGSRRRLPGIFTDVSNLKKWILTEAQQE